MLSSVVQVIQVLSAHSADMGVINLDNCTPLHYAAAAGDSNCCRFLTQRGTVRENTARHCDLNAAILFCFLVDDTEMCRNVITSPNPLRITVTGSRLALYYLYTVSLYVCCDTHRVRKLNETEEYLNTVSNRIR